LWQKKFFDHVLRSNESPEGVARYLAESGSQGALRCRGIPVRWLVYRTPKTHTLLTYFVDASVEGKSARLTRRPLQPLNSRCFHGRCFSILEFRVSYSAC
jgi:hypothetical protein